MTLRYITLTLALIGAFFSSASSAEYQLLDRAVAIVEDDVIMASEVRQSMAQIKQSLQQRGTALPPDAALYEQVLERSILEKLQLQRAQKIGLRISDQQLNETMTDIAARNGMNLTQFRQSLENNNESYIAIREKIRSDMLIQQTQRRSVFRKIQISESEIENFLNSEEGKALLTPEYNIDHILLPLDSNASSNAVARAQEKLHALREQLIQNSATGFADATTELTAISAQHSPLGWRKLQDIPSLFTSTIETLQPGQLSKPIKSGSGYHVIWLLKKRGGVKRSVEETNVRHILISENAIRDDRQAQQLAQTVKEKLNAGAEFSDMAKQYSDDPGSALAGGELGWTEPNKLVPAFEYVMNTIAIGKVSEPFKTQFGWHILEVLERRNKDLSDDQAKRIAQMTIADSKYNTALQNWLQELRDNAFIEIK